MASKLFDKADFERIEKILDEQGRPILIRMVAGLLKIAFMVYDVISYIPFKIFADPKLKIQMSERVKAAPTIAGDPSSPWRNIRYLGKHLQNEIFSGCDTLSKVWDEAVRRYGDSDCFGVREVLSVVKEKQENGRIFEKMELGDYHWSTYEEVGETVTSLAKGLVELGQHQKNNVVIFADTREEWMLTALACFKCNFPIVTVYATLGEEALAFAINECDAAIIFTTTALLPKATKKCPSIKTIVYYAPQDPEAAMPRLLEESPSVHVLHFADLIEDGQDSEVDVQMYCAKSDDIALIMYTSGTTGNPKGVMMSHKNIIAATAGQAATLPVRNDDVYIGYLPLAHILEVCAELVLLAQGCKIGYSSAQTLFDRASKLKKGQKGDCRVLKPTLMACVPAVMDRIYKAVSEEISQTSRLMREIFRVCYERKKARYEEGYSSILLNRLAFNKICGSLGGRIRIMLSGGAPLNPETQRFMNICFCCPVVQGYGLTETCGGGTLGDVYDLGTGSVGAPLGCCEIMLREWPEAGYSPLNGKPQGEILISGDNVTLGYYKNEAKTKEDFIVINGKRWFASGDIGEFRNDGSLCIIDRKKDLLKLAHGEYVSLGKVETTLLTNPNVENLCVYGDSTRDYLVALVVPNGKSLKQLAEKVGISEHDGLKLSNETKVVNELLNELQTYAKGKLTRMEIPQKIYVCNEVWTPASGLLTEALKLKRRAITKQYQSQIIAMYR